MAEELDRMHRSFGNIFSNDLTDEGLASGVEYTVHQKFMQMAPLSDRFGSCRDVERA